MEIQPLAFRPNAAASVGKKACAIVIRFTATAADAGVPVFSRQFHAHADSGGRPRSHKAAAAWHDPQAEMDTTYAPATDDTDASRTASAQYNWSGASVAAVCRHAASRFSQAPPSHGHIFSPNRISAPVQLSFVVSTTPKDHQGAKPVHQLLESRTHDLDARHSTTPIARDLDPTCNCQQQQRQTPVHHAHLRAVRQGWEFVSDAPVAVPVVSVRGGETHARRARAIGRCVIRSPAAPCGAIRMSASASTRGLPTLPSADE
ncbi:hypothetical protein BD311DRAFT_805780 [Dichomitus squalens]|uniref:Uncharacterized protein n=1 Tax=Dichomitus squalens TaxID=114155 RepID=A0A4Q9MQB2_9APHY|nr:hypothetical protein BD311DRAFT_805780 [Dichomitus squalens]